MRQLVIDRSIWRTGGDVYIYNKHFGSTQLLNRQGKMCCLGFYCERIAGINKYDLYYRPTPFALKHDFFDNDDINVLIKSEKVEVPTRYYSTSVEKVVETIKYSDSEFSIEAIQINDDENISNEQREQLLTEHFKTINIELIFINEYPKINLVDSNSCITFTF
jgi:hypothetical protein